MQPNNILNEYHDYNAMWKEKDHHVLWYFKHTVTIIKHCDHNYEISSYICNPFRPALIWLGNCFEEIYKLEIGVSNYLDNSRIYLLLSDFFLILLPSQASLPAHASFRVKRDSFHDLSIPQCQWMFFCWNHLRHDSIALPSIFLCLHLSLKVLSKILQRSFFC